MAAMHLAAGSRSLATLPYPNQWGNLAAKVLVGNATANVTCPVDPAPTVTEIVQHYSASPPLAWSAGGCHALLVPPTSRRILRWDGPRWADRPRPSSGAGGAVLARRLFRRPHQPQHWPA